MKLLAIIAPMFTTNQRLEVERAAAYKRLEAKIEKTSHKYPEKKLDFTANILSSKAVDFYKRHGVEKIERAAEFGAEIGDRPLMTLKLCLRRRLELCPGGGGEAKPLYLEDEEGRLFRPDFDCAVCLMTVKQNRRGGAAGLVDFGDGIAG